MEMNTTKRLLLVDDHRMFREMLGHLLSTQKDLEIVGTAGTTDEALEKIAVTQPDVVTIDTILPDGSGIELAQSLKADCPNVVIILLASSKNDEMVIQAIRRLLSSLFL